MKYPAYPKYKASGIEWLGDVPGHWGVKRGRFLMQVNPRISKAIQLEPEVEVSFVPMEAVGVHGGLTLDQAKPLNEIGAGYTEFQDGDVVVAKITPCFENGKGALAKGLINGVAFGTTELHVLRASEKLNERFLFYITISHVYRKTGEAEMYGAGGQKRVPPEFNKDFRVGIPPFSEQRAIADFLDAQTAKLDTLMAKKQELIERLKEKRTALISRTVTRGLPPEAALAAGFDPYPKLKPSGIEWLGDMPEHWTPGLLGRFFRLQRGFDISGADEVEEGHPVISSGGISGKTEVAPCKAPGVIIGRKGTLGTVHYSDVDYWPHDTTLWIKDFKKNSPRFCFYYLKHLGLEYLDNGASNPTLNRNYVHPIPITFPSPIEQRAIADYLDRETAKIDRMIEKINAAIGKLREYRSALITAAVTGRIDVREVRG